METVCGLEDGGCGGLGGGDLWLRESAMEEEEEEEDGRWREAAKVEKKEEVDEVEEEEGEEDVPGPEGRSGQERLAPEEEAAFQVWVNGECKILTAWKLNYQVKKTIVPFTRQFCYVRIKRHYLGRNIIPNSNFIFTLIFFI